jgi:16S rRNA U516 pseudouridylate synthase RsuA-like enzyme
MWEALGVRVRRLRRVRIGRLTEAALGGRKVAELKRPLKAVLGGGGEFKKSRKTGEKR